MSFTDGSEPLDAGKYVEEESALGRVYIPREGVLISGPVRVRYEKHPWLECFELDGIKPAPARRTGIGTKRAKGFVKSLSTIYAPAYDEYYEYGGDDSFDTAGYFAHAADYFVRMAGVPQMAKMYRKFTGFVENMWREGDREMLETAMDTVLPVIEQDAAAWQMFCDNITEEFREYLRKGEGPSAE